ncbi:MAG: hypothetical protein ACRD27_11455 [Terracidiphilus sp.]
MNVGLSDKIRAVAQTKYVSPAMLAGKGRFSIRVRDLLGDLNAEGFPGGHTPQVCSALQTSKFLRENGLEIEAVDGPPSKMSPTVVVRYRVANSGVRPDQVADRAEEKRAESGEETPEEWAHRMTGKLRGLLKEELAAYGGGEAFLRWVRGYDEEDEA